MDKSEKLDHSLLGKQRKTVETVFSSLEKLGCQNFNSRSDKGLESRFEGILLAYSVLLSRAQRRFEEEKLKTWQRLENFESLFFCI